MSNDDWGTAVTVLRLATQLVNGIQEGLARRGFEDVRPAHGFAFVRISSGDATTAKVAEHLGVTKQAGAQLVDQLVERGYVERRPDPLDGRARRLVLTDRGHACTVAAEAAAAETVGRWKRSLNESDFEQFAATLRALAEPGQLRPLW